MTEYSLKNKVKEFKDIDGTLVTIRVSKVPASVIEPISYYGVLLLGNPDNYKILKEIMDNIMSYQSIIRKDGTELKLSSSILIDANISGHVKAQLVQEVLDYNLNFSIVAPLYQKLELSTSKMEAAVNNMMNILDQYSKTSYPKNTQQLKSSEVNSL